MRKKFLSYVNEFWKINLLVLFALFSISLLYLHINQETFSFQWFVKTILLPFIISCVANISTANKQNEKIRFFEKRDMEMNSICSEIVGSLKTSVNKTISETDLKHLLSQAKKLQLSIIYKGNTDV